MKKKVEGKNNWWESKAQNVMPHEAISWCDGCLTDRKSAVTALVATTCPYEGTGPTLSHWGI